MAEKKKVSKKFPWYYYLILVAIPILLFTVLEVGLRLADYGTDYKQWVQIDEKHQLLNPDFARRYFHNTKSAPSSSNDVFDIDKHKNAFRVFILGGSSAAGYPYSPNGSFAKYVRKRLKVIYPRKKIEVINCSMAAVNTYTLLDMVPGIIEQKPDLVLIYAGHNEFYGALGVGSLESFGNLRPVVKLSMFLNEYKSFQLTRNMMRAIVGWFSTPEKTSGTLMSRMAKEQSIVYNSDLFNLGMMQFEANMDDILSEFKESNVPVLIGNLASNLKDQKPFISAASDNIPAAEAIFNKAKAAYNDSNFVLADSLFRYSKDLDMLRFRAPEKINKIIKTLSDKHNAVFVNIDSAINSLSTNGIVGNNLMTDHLHPTLEGYQVIGKSFFEAADKSDMLPVKQKLKIPYVKQNERVVNNYDFTTLDSIIARYRIIILKADWPYVERKLSDREVVRRFNPEGFADTLAMMVVNNKMNWEAAHRSYGEYMLRNGDVNQFVKEYNSVIDKYPVITDYYRFAVEKLVAADAYDEAYSFAMRKHKIEPDAFSNKWIGIIDLNRKMYAKAVGYLKESRKLNLKDPQVLYNLAGAYYNTKDFQLALGVIKECLAINPNYPSAQRFHDQLVQIVNPVINLN